MCTEADTPEPLSSTPQQRTPEDIITSVMASANERAAVRAARRAQFAQTQPEPKMCLVAWIDLLGFREQIVNADTPEKFRAAYQRIRDVQAEFDLETASAEPDQGQLNESMGKTIVALSDGLVIALDLEGDSPAAAVHSEFERIGMFLESLRLAQARCASVGNFVRGGVALGFFWFAENILLSPALVQAYEMESKRTLARNPVIILRRELAEALQSSGESYSNDWNPVEGLFRECEWMADEERAEHVMLNFMPVFLEEEDPTPFLLRYHQHVTEKRAAAPEQARSKYDWLMFYLREFVTAELPLLEGTIFPPPAS